MSDSKDIDKTLLLQKIGDLIRDGMKCSVVNGELIVYYQVSAEEIQEIIDSFNNSED